MFAQELSSIIANHCRRPQGVKKAHDQSRIAHPHRRRRDPHRPYAVGLRLQHHPPTLEEQAKAKWADVQNNYQRRADLIPNLVATVQGYAKQETDVLTAVIEARAKATPVPVDASQLTDPEKLKQFQDAQNQLQRRARAADRGQRELSRPEVEPELPRPAVAARRHREPHRRGAARLHRSGAGLQHRAAHLPRRDLGLDPLPRQQADGGVHRQRRRADAAASEVLTATSADMTALAQARAWQRGCRAAAAACAVARCVGLRCRSALALTSSAADRARRRSGRHHHARHAQQRLRPNSPISRANPASSWLWRRSIRSKARRSSLMPTQLFRTWKLGEKTKNNGVLLLVAPNERRVRIEVGYGLEGTLTDALSTVIIANAITPRFKAGDFSRRHLPRRRRHHHRAHHRCLGMAEAALDLRLDRDAGAATAADWFVTMLLIAFVTLFFVWPGFRWFVLNVLLNILLNSGLERAAAAHGAAAAGRGGGGGSGGGFSRAGADRRAAAAAHRGDGDEHLEHDRHQISAAIRAAEQRTSGEIVCVLAETPVSRSALPGLDRSRARAALPWLLIAVTAMTVQEILLPQIIVFLVVARNPACRRAGGADAALPCAARWTHRLARWSSSSCAASRAPTTARES